MRNTHGRRLATAMGAAAALVALTATGAQAAAPAAAPEKVTHTGTVAPATSSGNGTAGGSLVQGWQFCLLASCETHAGGGGAQGVQGMNFCLLAFCSVRG